MKAGIQAEKKKKVKVQTPNFMLTRKWREGLEERMSLWIAGMEDLWSEVEVCSPTAEGLLPAPKGIPASSGLGPPGSMRLTL